MPSVITECGDLVNRYMLPHLPYVALLQSVKHLWRKYKSVMRLISYCSTPASIGIKLLIWELALIFETFHLANFFYERYYKIKSLASKNGVSSVDSKSAMLYMSRIVPFLGKLIVVYNQTKSWLALDNWFPKSSQNIFVPVVMICESLHFISMWYGKKIKTYLSEDNFFTNNLIVSLFIGLSIFSAQATFTFYKGFCDVRE